MRSRKGILLASLLFFCCGVAINGTTNDEHPPAKKPEISAYHTRGQGRGSSRQSRLATQGFSLWMVIPAAFFVVVVCWLYHKGGEESGSFFEEDGSEDQEESFLPIIKKDSKVLTIKPRRKVYKADVLLGKDIVFRKLGIWTVSKGAIVNASNAQISFGGGGTNGALCSYARANGMNGWGEMRDAQNLDVKELEVGGFAISKVVDLSIVHINGPQDLAAAYKLRSAVLAMLAWAKSAKITTLVLPAISTGIFSGGDQDKCRAFYTMLIEGLEEGIVEYDGTVVLNRWDEGVVRHVPCLG